MKTLKDLIPVVMILALVIFFGLLLKKDYEKFNFNPETNCEEYYETCVCYGTLSVMEIYPPQYHCNGIGYCEDIEPSRIECKNDL